MDRKEEIRQFATDLGFDLVGFAPPVLPTAVDEVFRAWIGAGHHGCMQYLARRVEQSITPGDLLADLQSIVVLGVSYLHNIPAPPAGHGRISRYACFRDYHKTIGKRLRQLERFVAEKCHGNARGFVDTGPLSERACAVAAGLGFIGRNSMLITPEYGSWVFLAVLLTDLELPPDATPAGCSCGSCRNCIDACPAGAINDDKTIDARKCLSCLTIESRDPIPPALRPALGDRIFGCDTCQQVCPLNQKAKTTEMDDFRSLRFPGGVPLSEILSLDDAAFGRRFAGTPVMRAKRLGLQCNAVIAAGNAGADDLIGPLEDLARAEPSLAPSVKWSLARLQ